MSDCGDCGNCDCGDGDCGDCDCGDCDCGDGDCGDCDCGDCIDCTDSCFWCCISSSPGDVANTTDVEDGTRRRNKDRDGQIFRWIMCTLIIILGSVFIGLYFIFKGFS